MRHIGIICLKLIFLAVVFFATAFLSFDNLVETQLLSKSYALIAGSIICSVFIVVFGKVVRISVDRLTVLVLLSAGYVLLRMGLVGRFGLDFMLVISFLLLYFFFKAIGNIYNDYISLVILLVCVSQAILGLLQYTGIIYVSGFRMMASFDNPAGVAALLSAGLPFSFPLIRKSNFLKYLGWASLSIIIIAIILSGSRSGILAITFVCIIFIINEYKDFFIRHKSILISIAVIFCIFGIGLSYLKKDSAKGRMLIWKISIEMIKEKPIFGHGPEAFMADYMVYQAKYFKNNPDSKYAQLAGNVTHPFNEYIFLTIEYGILGLLLFLAILSYIIFNTRKLTSYHLCLLSIVVFSCFSYPTRYACIVLLLAYCLSNLKPVTNRDNQTRYIGRIMWFAVIPVLSFMLIRDVKFESKWGNLVSLGTLGKHAELLGNYSDLYDHWNGNPLFLYNYGAVLNRSKEFSQSLFIMNKCKTHYNDYDIQMTIADNYYNLSNFKESLTHYQLSSYMCPNRFIPMYKQVLIYDETGEYEKALSLATQIIKKPVKVQSAIIDRIITEMNEYININSAACTNP